MEVNDLSGQEQDGSADEVMDSLGEETPTENVPQADNATHMKGDGNNGDTLPEGVKARLGRQEKRHQREMRDMRMQMDAMHNRLSSPDNNSAPLTQAMNPQTGQPLPAGSIDEQIQKAVTYALQHKELQERQAQDATRKAHVAKSYQALNDHLDSASDKYDDFDETVRGEDVPFTDHMRDAALLLPKSGAGSAAEVLYKLGKNKSELERISKLHPLDQASEMVKLSHALMGGNEKSSSSQSRPLGSIKSNPATNSGTVTEKTPVSDLRKRMRAGWK